MTLDQIAWLRSPKGHRRAHVFVDHDPWSYCGRLRATGCTPLEADELTALGQPNVGEVCSSCLDFQARLAREVAP